MDALKAELIAHKGVLTVPVERLMKAYGTERWNSIVRTNISKHLAGQGIAHVPKELPASNLADVRLFQRGSVTEDIIKAASTPGLAGDEIIRRVCNPEHSDEVLRKIKNLLIVEDR